MRRILLLITDLEIGGTPTVVCELALRLTASGGAHIHVACLSRRGPVADQIAAGGVAVTVLNAAGVFSLPIIVRRLVQLIRAEQIDTVFSFLVHANLVAALASLFCRRIRWLQSIQTTQPNPRWHWRVQAFAQRRAKRIVVPSESVAEAARQRSGVPAEKITVISNAIDLAGFANISRTSDGRQIGFIGRLDPIKRIGDLLAAMPLLDRPIHLHIFGEGRERLHIEATIARLGLTDRVTLHGSIARPQDALAKIDLLVLPSQAEGFGLVLIEGMAAGVPVVATDVPGIRNVVQSGLTGQLVPVASPPLLASAIAGLISNPARRNQMTARALEDVRRRFSWDVILPEYQRLLGI